MPEYIVKASPDEDFYVVWSTVVDAPTQFGTREELAAELGRFHDGQRERFDRADQTGTSARWPDWPIERQPFNWFDAGFIVREVEITDRHDGENGSFVMPRANLKQLCLRLYAGRPVDDLLRFVPDEEPTES